MNPALCLLLGSLAASQDPVSEDLFRTADRLRKEDKVQESLEAFKSLLERKPDHLEGHLGYQKLLQSQKKEAALVEEYGKLLAKRKDPWAHYLYGRLLREPKEAEAVFREGLKLDPKNFELRIALADALRRDLRAEEAAREYREVLPDRPEALREHLAYINLMRDLGRPEEILADYKARSEKSLGDFRAHVLYASALVTFRIKGEVKAHLDRALELAPGSVYPLSALGVFYVKSGEVRKAEEAFSQALRADPYHAGTLYQLGMLLVFLRNDDRGFEYLNTAARLAPDSSTIFSDLGAAYFSRKKVELAEESLREAIRLDPTNEWAAHRMGLIASVRGDVTRAVEWQKRAVELSPHMADFHAALGRACERAGRLEEAKDAFERAEALRRKRP